VEKTIGVQVFPIPVFDFMARRVKVSLMTSSSNLISFEVILTRPGSGKTRED
jgi:hypothetical protein